MNKLNINKKTYTRQDIISLLKLQDKEAINDLYFIADMVKRKYFGDTVHVRSIVEFSNHCCRNCLYCGLRKSNEKIERYRIEPEDIVKYALKAVELGFKTIILQSGEDFYYTAEKIEQIIKSIKSRTDLKITLSVGERPEVEYKRFKDAGADRFLLKHETSDPVLYRYLHPDLKYADRIKCLRTLKSLGYELGSGIMVGLPGQTLESIANDILLFRDFNIDMMGIGPYIPHPDTPLARKFEEAGGYFLPAIGDFNAEEMIYKIIAITRLVTRKAHIPVTTGFNTLSDTNIREKALHCGANVIMLNITDANFRELYEIYPAKKELAKRNIETIENLSKSLSGFEFV